LEILFPVLGIARSGKFLIQIYKSQQGIGLKFSKVPQRSINLALAQD
jgi:hypothetical protein